MSFPPYFSYNTPSRPYITQANGSGYRTIPFQSNGSAHQAAYPYSIHPLASFHLAKFQAETEAQMKEAAKAKADEASIWRDTALRYGGYADEIGEFASPYLGGFGKFIGYGVSTLYCFADLGSTLLKKIGLHRDEPVSNGKKATNLGLDMLDLGLFHAVATLWIPPKLIGTVVEIADQTLDPESHPLKEDAGWIERRLVHPISEKLRPLVQPMVQRLMDKTEPWVEGRTLTKANTILAKQGPSLARKTRWIADLSNRYNQLASRLKLPQADNLHDDLNVLVQKAEKGQFKARELTKLLLIKPLPVLIGIGMVPLIAHPFDELMTKFLNWVVRPLMGKNKWEKADNLVGYRPVRNPNYWKGKAQVRENPILPVASGNVAAADFVQSLNLTSTAYTGSGMGQ